MRGNELNGHLRRRESISDRRSHTAADRVIVRESEMRFKSNGVWKTTVHVKPRYDNELFYMRRQFPLTVCVNIQIALWNQNIGLSDSFVVEQRYRTEWFILCGAKISDWVIHSLRSKDIWLSDLFFVEQRYLTEWFILCGAKISEWFIRCGVKISDWLIYSLWSKDIWLSDSFVVE